MNRGAPAHVAYDVWSKLPNKWKASRDAVKAWQAQRAELSKAVKAVKTAKNPKLPVRVKILNRAGVVVGVITFVYVAATDNVAVAAEQGTRDAMFPVLEIAEAITSDFGALADAMYEAGQLSKKSTANTMFDLIERNRGVPGELSCRKLKCIGGDLPRQ